MSTVNPSLALNSTHDAARRSWVDSANVAGAEFPIQNLPLAVFRAAGSNEAARCGVGIGDQLLDLGACAHLFDGLAAEAAAAGQAPVLNRLMQLGPRAASALRAQLSDRLAAGHSTHRAALAQALRPLAEVELLLPVQIGGYTDFFTSIHHATNAGRLFRPDQPLLPNYKYVPIAYNGRANSVRVSGSPVQRPWGQRKAPDANAPVYAPSQRMDHEVELGAYIGQATRPGQPLQVRDAWNHLFGFSLLNDWSARDIQGWEYQPLGPFLGKSFATSVSPWVITAEALAPFRVAAAVRPEGDPAPLPHLWDAADQQSGALRISLQASLCSAQMRAQGLPAMLLSRADAATLYWTFAQMAAHHTSNGSALDVGDLLGSGTVSGPNADGTNTGAISALGSLLEITAGGTRPLTLAGTGEQRGFLADGDELTLTARCERPGFVGIGFGSCRGRLDAAAQMTDKGPG